MGAPSMGMAGRVGVVWCTLALMAACATEVDDLQVPVRDSGVDAGRDAGRVAPGVDSGGVVPRVDSGTRDAGDASSGLEQCEEAEAAFQAFLAANRSCSSDADCTTVGDCGPYIRHEPVNLDGAAQARTLQQQACESGYDGLTDGAECSGGTCVAVPNGGECCGCGDSGVDEDAGHSP